jgi:hypothetical protein
MKVRFITAIQPVSARSPRWLHSQRTPAGDEFPLGAVSTTIATVTATGSLTEQWHGFSRLSAGLVRRVVEYPADPFRSGSAGPCGCPAYGIVQFMRQAHPQQR